MYGVVNKSEREKEDKKANARDRFKFSCECMHYVNVLSDKISGDNQ